MSVERLSDIATLIGIDWMNLLDSAATHDLIGQFTRSAWFPKSATVQGAQLCKELVHHERIRVSTSTDYKNSAGDVEVATIYATGCDIPNEIGEMPIEAIVIPGQVDGFTFSEPRKHLQHVVAHNGYVAPQYDMLFAGSTYEYSPWPSGEAMRTNKARIESLLPGVPLEHKSVFRANRVVSSDRLPIAGEIANDTWVSWAHGSGGTITAPFAAELVASAVLKEIPPGSIGIPRLLSPERFRIRQRRRPNPLTRGFKTGPRTT